MKKILAVLCMAAMLVGLLPPVTGLADGNAVTEARNGVVRVASLYYDEGMLGTGTGFLISNTENTSLFVTNAHVVEDQPDAVLVVMDKLDLENSEGTVYEATYVIPFEGIDLAFLITDRVSERVPLPLRRSDEVSVTDEVYALGFPGVADGALDEGNVFPSTVEDISVTRGVISKLNAVIETAASFQHDATINRGNSGGPLLSADGCVLGVNTWTTEPGTNFAIHIDYIVDYLEEHDIDYLTKPLSGGGTTSPTAPPDNQGPSATAPPATGSPPTAAPSGPVSPSDKDGDGASGGIDGKVIAIAAVAVAAVAVVLFLVLRRRPAGGAAPVYPAPPAPAPAPPPETPPVPAPAAPGLKSLLCTSGRFSGNTFPLNGSLVIGRDPARCKIVYPADTPGVSSVHCEIILAGGTVQLIDRGSSYGTYLANGTKLAPGVPQPLGNGDGFYLGSRENAFLLI